MKNLVLWIFVAIFVATFRRDPPCTFEAGRESQQQPGANSTPVRKHGGFFPGLRLAMEKYRRASGNFRKMYNNEIAASKAHLRNEFAQKPEQTGCRKSHGT